MSTEYRQAPMSLKTPNETDAPTAVVKTPRKDPPGSRIGRILIPEKPRQFTGERWLNILLRSLHLVGVAGIGGGFLFTLDESQWLPYWHLTVSTGVILSLLYIWSSAIWLFQLKGVSIVVKLALIALATASPAWRAELFILVIVISGLVAHAPGRMRGYLILMRNRADRAGC